MKYFTEIFNVQIKFKKNFEIIFYIFIIYVERLAGQIMPYIEPSKIQSLFLFIVTCIFTEESRPDVYIILLNI